MNEPKRVIMRAVAIVCFTIGLLLFLSGIRSTGEAPGQFKLTMSGGPILIGGAALIVLAALAYGLLYLWERRKHLEPLP